MSLIAILKEREKKKIFLKKEAVKEALRLAGILKQRFNFDSLYIFGSILTDKFRVHSDIDIVIRGLESDEFFKAYGLLIKESRYKIDLKPYEELSDDFKEMVMKRGKRIG